MAVVLHNTVCQKQGRPRVLEVVGPNTLSAEEDLGGPNRHVSGAKGSVDVEGTWLGRQASRSYHLLLRAERGPKEIQEEIVLGVESLPHVAETDTEGGVFCGRRISNNRRHTYLWFRSQCQRRLQGGGPACLALLDGKGVQNPLPHLFGLRGLKGIDTGR